MSSLMDVMFLILVFFIYCIFDMAVHKGVKVDLPTAKGTVERGEKIVVTILPDDSLQLNGRNVKMEDVVSGVKALCSQGVKANVIVSGDNKASLGTGISILSDLKVAGITNVSFQVKGRRR
jgi:biopolymer transport protein ExbD